MVDGPDQYTPIPLLGFYIWPNWSSNTHQRKIIILHWHIKYVLPSILVPQVHITFSATFSCRILTSTPILVWRKSYMSIGWMSPKHLEARILIHQNSRCFSPFVSWFEIIMYKSWTCWNVIRILLFIVIARFTKLSWCRVQRWVGVV
jgi:hypothetical protein